MTIKNAFQCFDAWGYITMTADHYVESDSRPEKTGLLNAEGVPLYKVKEKLPFGFRGKNG